VTDAVTVLVPWCWVPSPVHFSLPILVEGWPSEWWHCGWWLGEEVFPVLQWEALFPFCDSPGVTQAFGLRVTGGRWWGCVDCCGGWPRFILLILFNIVDWHYSVCYCYWSILFIGNWSDWWLFVSLLLQYSYIDIIWWNGWWWKWRYSQILMAELQPDDIIQCCD